MSADPKTLYYDEWVAQLPSLSGKVVAITGTTSGTGYWAAICAIRKNAKALILLNRASNRVTTSLETLTEEKERVGSETEIVTVECDLMSFDSVKEAATKVNSICAEKGGLNVLANNAGIMAFPDDRTKDGYDVQIQVNHLSQYLLTKLIFPSLKLALDNKQEVRICQHSSAARYRTSKDLEEKYFSKCEANTLGGNDVSACIQRYHQTKLANTCFAMALHKKLIENGFDVNKIKSVVADPGVATTSLQSNLMAGHAETSWFSRLIKRFVVFLIQFVYYGKMQSAADGSLPLIQACFGDNVGSGDFIIPEKTQTGKPKTVIQKGANVVEGHHSKETMTLSESNQDLIWTKSEEECGSIF